MGTHRHAFSTTAVTAPGMAVADDPLQIPEVVVPSGYGR
jgi:hypothetical protein